MDIQLVWQRTGRTYAPFLLRHADDQTTQRRLERRNAAARKLTLRWHVALRRRQMHVTRVRIGEIEHRCQITRNRPTPRRNIGFVDAKAFLDELDDGGVIEHL